MYYFDCCPSSEGNDAIETTITTQNFTARPSIHGTSYNRRRQIGPSSTAAWNTSNCNSPVNPYHVLELRRDATPSEIIESYRKLALIYHPGRKISCPLERRKRIQFFEVLAACYETLMHSEYRRRCDVLLKEKEKKQNTKPNSQMTRSGYKTAAIISEGTGTQLQLQLQQLRSHPHGVNRVDSIPGLIPSTSQSSSNSGGGRSKHSVGNSEESNETLPRNNCSSIAGILTCVAGPEALKSTYSRNNSFTISRDGTKGFKSLVDSSSLSASHSQASAEDEAEIHFSEATVNRLFGGPLASLHRARNFQAFSDPYSVFDKVFGNKKPIFPRVTIADIDVTAEQVTEEAENCRGNSSILPFRSLPSQLSNPEPDIYLVSTKNKLKNMNSSLAGSDYATANTKVFVSSRVVNGRKITKTESIHVDPMTGIASVNVTVDGEYLDPVRSNKKSPQLYVADWLLCFGTAKVTPPTLSSSSAAKKLPPPKSLDHCSNNEHELPQQDDISSSCHSFKSLYVEALEEFYLCNQNFYDECNKYMRCGSMP